MQPRSPRVAGGGGQQDARAHPKDHINRTHGSSRAGDTTFITLNLGLWVALAAAFRKVGRGGLLAAPPTPTPRSEHTTNKNTTTKKKSLRGPGAVLGVQAVVAMDLVRALRHCFWKLAIGQVKGCCFVVLSWLL